MRTDTELKQMQAFGGGRAEQMPGFEYVKGIEGIEVLTTCTHSGIRQRFVDALDAISKESYEESRRITISVEIAPLVYALQVGFSPNVLQDLRTDVLMAIKDLELTPDCQIQRLREAFNSNEIVPYKYALYGMFPKSMYNGVFGNTYKVHSYLFSKSLLPDWWSSDISLYMKVLDLTRVWEFPYYAENVHFLTKEDAESIKQQGHFVNLFAFLWSRDLKKVLKYNDFGVAARQIGILMNKVQYEQWFAVCTNDRCLAVMFCNYYQLKDEVLREVVSVLPHTAMISGVSGSTAVSLRDSSSSYRVVAGEWERPVFKYDFNGECFPAKTFVRRVLKAAGCADAAESLSDFCLVVKILPRILDALKQCKDKSTEQLAGMIREIVC